MEIGAPLEDKITVEIEGVKFVFPPSSQQDLIFALSLTNYLSGEIKVPPVDMDTAIKHVIAKLQAIEGEITSQGKALTIEELKAMANRVRPKFAIQLATRWALTVLQQSGLYGGTDEKKDDKSE